MKFKNSDELVKMILNNKLKVEMKLKEGITQKIPYFNLGVTFMKEKRNGLNVNLKTMQVSRQFQRSIN